MEAGRLSRRVFRTLCAGGAMAALVASSAGAAPSSPGSHKPRKAVGLAQVGITKTADQSEVGAGDQIGFGVTISNSGTGTALGVSSSDDLPAGENIDWTLDQANTDPGWTLTGSPPDQHLAYSAD